MREKIAWKKKSKYKNFFTNDNEKFEKKTCEQHAQQTPNKLKAKCAL